MSELDQLIELYNTGYMMMDQRERMIIKLLDERQSLKVYIDQLERSTTEILENR